MNELINEPKRLINYYADLAIKESKNFSEAMNLIQEFSDLSILGNAIKKAIQDEITRRTLNSKTTTINEETIISEEFASKFSALRKTNKKVTKTIGQDKKTLGDICVEVSWINRDEFLQTLERAKEKAEELNKLIQQLNDFKITTSASVQ
ncbi:hypothetical protein ACVRW4_08390 [Streptococcus phocae subsp. phocae]